MAAMFPISKETNFLLKSWKCLLTLSVIFFAPFIFNFLWGNHDWQWIKEYTPLWSGLFEGRFSQFFLQTLLFNGNILPILTLITSLAFYTAAAILLLKLWDVPTQQWLFLLLGLNLITSPYTLSWLYFAFITLSCLSWPFFIIVGFWLLNWRHTAKQHRYSLFIAASICFLMALGGYPPVINLIGTIFFTLTLSSLCFKKEKPQTILRQYLPYGVSIISALATLLLIQYFLKKYHLQLDTYNTAGLNLNNFNEKLHAVLIAASNQFFIPTSFITPQYKYTFSFLFLLAIIQLYAQMPKTIVSVLFAAILLLGLFFSPLITLFLAENIHYVIYEPRIAFFDLIYIYTFAAAILLQSPHKLLRNTAVLCLTIGLIHNLHTIAYAAKTWILGFKAETAFSERFLSRVEAHPNFSLEKKYTFIQGGNLNFRQRYYIADSSKIDSYTLSAPYIPWHLPSKAYQFYYPQPFIAHDFDTFWQYLSPFQIPQTPELDNYLSISAVPWPHANAVYIDDNTIILTLTPEGKSLAQNWQTNVKQNYPH